MDQSTSLQYSASELMCVNAAHLLRNGDVVFVGVGLPNLPPPPPATWQDVLTPQTCK